jgi:hypothetical protein
MGMRVIEADHLQTTAARAAAGVNVILRIDLKAIGVRTEVAGLPAGTAS